MTARSHDRGHPISYTEDGWTRDDDGSLVGVDDRPCRNCGCLPVPCGVFIPAELSHTEAGRFKLAKVDACVAEIVDALNAGGVMTLSSCCGHGVDGRIELADGRVIVVERSKPMDLEVQ